MKRQLRTRRIYYNNYLEKNGRNVLFRVGCEGGTYIRKLCFDVGEVLGVGAHMQELRRTRAGPFIEESPTFVTLHRVANWFAEWQEQKEDAILRRFIQPMENALALLPKIVVRDSAVRSTLPRSQPHSAWSPDGGKRDDEGCGWPLSSH